MAKFAQYYLKYKLDDLFAQETKADRQKFFGALFEKDESIEFAVGEGEDRKVFKHKVYHLSLNKDINTKIGFPQSANITPPRSPRSRWIFLYYFPKIQPRTRRLLRKYGKNSVKVWQNIGKLEFIV